MTTRHAGRALLALCLLAWGGQPRTLAAAPGAQAGADLTRVAAGFHVLFRHDECTGSHPPQPDTCLHERVHERSFTFGGDAGTTYDVTLRIRGILEPTRIEGGEVPTPSTPRIESGSSRAWWASPSRARCCGWTW